MRIKIVIVLVLVVVLGFLPARAATVIWNNTAILGAPVNRPVTFSTASGAAFLVGTNIVYGSYTAQPTNGVATITNLAPLTYTVTIEGVSTAFRMPVPNDTNTYYAIDLITQGLSLTTPQLRLAAGTNVTINTNSHLGIYTLSLNANFNSLVISNSTFSGDGSGLTNLTATNLTGPSFNISDVQVRATNGWVDFSGFAGGIKAQNFQGNGSGLTNITATNLTGNVSANNLPGALPALANTNGASLTNLTAANLTGTLPSLNANNLTGITPGQVGAQSTNAMLTTLASSNGISLTNLAPHMFFRVCGPAVSGANYALETTTTGHGAFGEYSYDGLTWFAVPLNGMDQFTNSIGIHDPGFFQFTNGMFYIPHTLQSQDLTSTAVNFGLFATSDFINYSAVGTGSIPFNNKSSTAISWAPDMIQIGTNVLLYGTMTTTGATSFDGKIYALTCSNLPTFTSWTATNNAVLLCSNESPVITGSAYGTGNGLNDSFGFNIVTNTILTNNAAQSVTLTAGTYLHIAYNWNTLQYDGYTNTQAGMPQQLHLAITNLTSFTNSGSGGSEGGMFVQLPNGNYRFYGSVATGNLKGRFIYSDNTNGMIGGWTTFASCTEIPRATFGQSTVTILTGKAAFKLQAAIAAAQTQAPAYYGAAAVFSVRRVPSTLYNGPIMDVRRSSDSNVVSLFTTSSGDLDTNTLMKFVGTGSGFITTWYDQSGNQNNVVQSTNADQPTIVTAGVLNVDQNGFPTIKWGGATSLKSVRGVPVYGGFSTVGWYGRNWNTAAYASIISSDDYTVSPGGTGWSFNDSMGTTASAWVAKDMVVTSAGTGHFNSAIPYGVEIAAPSAAFLNSSNNGTFYEIETIAGGTNTGLWINGSATGSSSDRVNINGPSISSTANFSIGGAVIGDQQDGNISEVSLWAYTLNPAQQAATRANILGYYLGTTPNKGSLVNTISQPYFSASSGYILTTNSAFPGPYVSNGVSMFWNSNAYTYLRSSRAGATNFSDTLIGTPP